MSWIEDAERLQRINRELREKRSQEEQEQINAEEAKIPTLSWVENAERLRKIIHKLARGRTEEDHQKLKQAELDLIEAVKKGISETDANYQPIFEDLKISGREIGELKIGYSTGCRLPKDTSFLFREPSTDEYTHDKYYLGSRETGEITWLFVPATNNNDKLGMYTALSPTDVVISPQQAANGHQIAKNAIFSYISKLL